MAQADPRSTTRRAVMGVLVAAGIATPTIATALPTTSSNDLTFQGWWLEMDDLETRIEAAPQRTDDDQALIDDMAARAGDLQDLILQTPSSSRIAVEIKVKTLIRYFGNYDAVIVRPATDILIFIQSLPRCLVAGS